jgi:hypothetical protein
VVPRVRDTFGPFAPAVLAARANAGLDLRGESVAGAFGFSVPATGTLRARTTSAPARPHPRSETPATPQIDRSTRLRDRPSERNPAAR